MKLKDLHETPLQNAYVSFNVTNISYFRKRDPSLASNLESYMKNFKTHLTAVIVLKETFKPYDLDNFHDRFQINQELFPELLEILMEKDVKGIYPGIFDYD